MKTLILVRHAKSDWPENTDDFYRPLAEKGINDARKMAPFLVNENIKIDQMISSSAIRAKSTCALFAEEYKIPFSETENLYHASIRQFLEVISTASETTSTLALFSHNNGISDFANSLCGDRIQFKTCAVAIFQINATRWTDFTDGSKKLINYFKPKDII